MRGKKQREDLLGIRSGSRSRRGREWESGRGNTGWERRHGGERSGGALDPDNSSHHTHILIKHIHIVTAGGGGALLLDSSNNDCKFPLSAFTALLLLCRPDMNNSCCRGHSLSASNLAGCHHHVDTTGPNSTFFFDFSTSHSSGYSNNSDWKTES